MNVTLIRSNPSNWEEHPGSFGEIRFRTAQQLVHVMFPEISSFHNYEESYL